MYSSKGCRPVTSGAPSHTTSCTKMRAVRVRNERCGREDEKRPRKNSIAGPVAGGERVRVLLPVAEYDTNLEVRGDA